MSLSVIESLAGILLFLEIELRISKILNSFPLPP